MDLMDWRIFNGFNFVFKVVTDLTLKGMQYAAEESSKPNLDIMAGLQNILAEEENEELAKAMNEWLSKQTIKDSGKGCL